jgi:L-2-hydroxyglutarate oxidase LhgO
VSCDVDVAVIGAGVVGLACAAALARAGHEVLLIERHEGPARETTSRSSGVIHAGIYYAPGSLKAETCVEGRRLLYERCARERLPHRRTGKLIVAADAVEAERLEALYARGVRNGAGALELLDAGQVRRLEPRVRAFAGLLSPESGIVCAHALAASYAREAEAHGATLVYRTALEGLAPAGDGWRLETRGPGGPWSLHAGHVVNAAGLASDAVAALAGLDVDAMGLRLRPCKGDYFTLAPRLGAITRRLVYPVPSGAGLGIHVTMDLAGRYRAGPDAGYVDRPRYDVDASKARRFGAALRRYLPDVRDLDLTPDCAGVRPKLAGPGEAPRDFVLTEDPPGVVHLIGIESPGITSAGALARRVVTRLRR